MSKRGFVTTNPKSVVNYFEALYSMHGHVWGESVSDLAREAAAILKMHSLDYVPKVLDIGCGNGRDTLFFAKQGWKVTAVDVSSEALQSLKRQAIEAGVMDRIELIQSDLHQLHLVDQYDLIFSNYCLHYLTPDCRSRFFQNLMDHTSPNGIHALLVMRDMNEEIVGQLDEYKYFRTRELLDIYHDWNIIDVYDGFVPDQHPGTPLHEHSVSIAIVRRPDNPIKTQISLRKSNLSSVLLSLGLIILSVLLCTLGYSSLTSIEGSIANVWPGAILQVFASALLGGWGVLTTIIAGMITNAINVKTLYSVLAFTPANFIQSFIPAYYYRQQLKNGGWNQRIFRFLPFVFYGVLVPNLLGGLWGALALYWNHGGAFWHFFWKWTLANIPIAIILGWPLFRYVIPSFADEGWAVKGWWR